MLEDNWEDKHDLKLPANASCSNNNMILQSLHRSSANDHLTGSSSKIDVATLNSSGSNSQDGRFAFPINQPTSIEAIGFNHQFDNQFHQQNHISEMHAGQSSVDSNLQELIKFLSTNYGPMKTPLEVGTPEYMKLVEILKQSSVKGRGSSVEKLPGGLKENGSYSKDGVTNNIQNVESASLTEDKSSKSSICKVNQEKVSVSEKAAEQLWEGSLQLSSSVTLSAVAFFKSGEKLVGNNWPDFIEVKGKVRLEAFEKYVQDLPRSRNRGLMVTSICWNEESSNIGLNGMKEVVKGYKKSSRVGFAHLLSGTDLYICPRSDPIITILAKYGFFKGMSVIDDKPDSMIGCVVWRKNRPSNPVGNTLDGKNSPNLPQLQNSPPGFSLKQGAKKKLSPEKVESSQRDEPLTLPLLTACAEVDRNEGSSCGLSLSPLKSTFSSDSGNLTLKKRPFEDDDLPEFEFGVSCEKSTLVSRPINSKLDTFPLTQLPSVVNAAESNNDNNNNGSSKKTKLFDDDDMPEWRPPEISQPQQITTLNFQNLPLYPPLPPLPPPPLPSGPPPPRADTRSHQPFRPSVTTQPPAFMRPPQQPLLPPPPQHPLPPPPPQHPLQPAPTPQHLLRPAPPPQHPLRPAPPLQHPLPPPLPPSQPPSSFSGRFSTTKVLWHQPSFRP